MKLINSKQKISFYSPIIQELVVKMAEKNDSPGSTSTSTGHESQQLLSGFIAEIVKSPINLLLVGVIAFLVYKIVKSKTKIEEPVKEIKKLPKIRRDFTLEELKKYNGTGPDGRILIAINGSVYDCTRGAHFYGPGKYSTIPNNLFCMIVDESASYMKLLCNRNFMLRTLIFQCY